LVHSKTKCILIVDDNAIIRRSLRRILESVDGWQVYGDAVDGQDGIEKAKELIQSSNYSLTEIAYLTGFSDQSHFTRNFRELTNFLPKAYQKL